MAVLEIKNVFHDAQLSSFLNHTGQTHSRRLTNVPGERDPSFFCFLLKSCQLDQEGTSISFALQLETLLQDDIEPDRSLHSPPPPPSCSPIQFSHIWAALSDLTGSLDLIFLLWRLT